MKRGLKETDIGKFVVADGEYFGKLCGYTKPEPHSYIMDIDPANSIYAKHYKNDEHMEAQYCDCDIDLYDTEYEAMLAVWN